MSERQHSGMSNTGTVALAYPTYWKLGISLEGMLSFLVRIGFLQERDEDDETYDEDDIYEMFDYTSYERSEELLWVDEFCGPINFKQDVYGNQHKDWGICTYKGMTGYDLCHVIRQWVKENGFDDLSVCEIIMQDPRFEDLRHHISQATIFYSHLQKAGPIATLWHVDVTCMTYPSKLPKKENQFWWMDYFCLRQCQSDFKPEHVLSLIKDISTTVVEVDQSLVYFGRSFCILEIYATVAAGDKATLVCHTHAYGDVMKGKLASSPIDSRNATTKRSSDKALIDAFIRDSIGFDAFDLAVTKGILEGAQERVENVDSDSESGSGSDVDSPQDTGST
jgi:hypothetical protein